jgi:hypothetical protein
MKYLHLQVFSILALLFFTNCEQEEIIPQASPVPLSGIVPVRIDHLGGLIRYKTELKYVDCVLWQYSVRPFVEDPIFSEFEDIYTTDQFKYGNEKITTITADQNDYEIFIYDDEGQLEKSTRFRRDTATGEFLTVMNRVYTFERGKIVRIEDSANDRIEIFSYFEESGNLQSVLTSNTAGVLLREEQFLSYDTMNNPNKNLPLIHLDISNWIRERTPNNNLERRVTTYGRVEDTYTIRYRYTYTDSDYPLVRSIILGSNFFNDVYHYTSCGE